MKIDLLITILKVHPLASAQPNTATLVHAYGVFKPTKAKLPNPL